MQKVIRFLEAYVQWVVLGIALLWVGYVAYAYWLNPSDTIELAGQNKVAPGTVDDAVWTSSYMDQLTKALSEQNKIPQVVQDTLSPKEQAAYVKEFKNAMALSQPEMVLANSRSMWPGTVPSGPGGTPVPGNPGTQPAGPDKYDLPNLEGVVATIGVTNGTTMVLAPNSKLDYREVLKAQAAAQANPNPVQPAMAAGGNAVPGAPLVNPVLEMKVIQPDPEDQNAKPVVYAPTAVTWDTDDAKIDLQKIADSFTKAGIPDAAAYTQILRVQLIRQEKNSNGDWGEGVAVDDLPIQKKLPFPPKSDEDQVLYNDWASKHVADIVQPLFFEYLRGDVWRPASIPEIDPNVAQQPESFDPAKVKPGEFSKLTPEQQKLWREWKLQQDKAEQEKRKSEADGRRSKNAPSGGERGGGGGGGGSGVGGLGGRKYSPMAGEGERVTAPQRGTAARGGPDRGQMSREREPLRPTGPAGERFNPANSGNTYQPPTAQQVQINPLDLPPGPFRPSELVLTKESIETWAHDVTTTPGRVYRYKLRVSFRNPLWQNEHAKNPDDAKKLYIDSDSDWSPERQAPRKNAFFAINGGNSITGGDPKMSFEYFYWDDGEWKKKTLTLHAGDAIGTTPYTILDYRPIFGNNANENKALVIDDLGNIEEHTYRKDMASDEYKHLSALIRPVDATGSVMPTGIQPNTPPRLLPGNPRGS